MGYNVEGYLLKNAKVDLKEYLDDWDCTVEELLKLVLEEDYSKFESMVKSETPEIRWLAKLFIAYTVGI